jgi:serine/threonine-protein kinase
MTEATQIVRPSQALSAPPVVPVPVAAYQEVVHQAEHYGPPPGPLPPDEGGGAGRWWIALLIGLLVAGLIVGGLLLFGKEKVQVPNVVGIPQPEAELTLKHKGLSTDITPHESPNKPKGTVIGQDPAGGSRVAKGDVVTLFVSSGPGSAEIPDLTGKPRSAAIKTLEGLGFNATEQRTNSDTIKQNHVIETRPAAGEQRDKGSTVIVVISSGKQRVAAPDVTGQSDADARSALEALGFQVSTKPQDDTQHDPGTVLSQDPPAGTSLPKGTKITLTVAKEPKPVDVPDVTGQGRLVATHTLQKAGFKVDVVPQKTGDRTQDRHVLQQDPTGGQAKKGSTVKITVGEYDPTLDTGSGTGTGTPDGAAGTQTTPTTPATTQPAP